MTSSAASSTPGRVRIGAQIAPQHALYPKIRETLTEVEALGTDVAFDWDHFFPLSGEKNGLHFESWTLLAAWAEQTSTIELGARVNCHSYRTAALQKMLGR